MAWPMQISRIYGMSSYAPRWSPATRLQRQGAALKLCVCVCVCGVLFPWSQLGAQGLVGVVAVSAVLASVHSVLCLFRFSCMCECESGSARKPPTTNNNHQETKTKANAVPRGAVVLLLLAARSSWRFCNSTGHLQVGRRAAGARAPGSREQEQ
jgi:hypothetical protein